MLRWYQERYDDGRQKVGTELLAQILIESLKISGINIPPKVALDTLFLFLSGVNYYFYLHPEQYVDLGRFALYRSSEPDNLIRIDSKEGQTAETIYDYYKRGGLLFEEMGEVLKAFAKGLISSAHESEKSTLEDIEKVRNLVSQRKAEENKENNNGI